MANSQTKGIFNGHTWIIVLVSIMGLILLGAGAEVGIFYLLASNDISVMSSIEALSVPAIPYTVVKGIEKIVKRLTYIPNVDTAETLKEDK